MGRSTLVVALNLSLLLGCCLTCITHIGSRTAQSFVGVQAILLWLCRTSQPSGPIFATRITPSGYLYFQPEAAAKTALAAAVGNAYPPFCPAELSSVPSSRKLLIWGPDGRVHVTKRTYPYSAVGQIISQEAGGGYLCSGALIERSAIFTAGDMLACGGLCSSQICRGARYRPHKTRQHSAAFWKLAFELLLCCKCEPPLRDQLGCKLIYEEDIDAMMGGVLQGTGEWTTQGHARNASAPWQGS